MENKKAILKPKKMLFSVQDQIILTSTTMQNLGIPLPHDNTESLQKKQPKNKLDVNSIPPMLLFDKDQDWQFQYHTLFMDNEMKLQQYDQLLQDRVKYLKLYQAMKNSDFSNLKRYENSGSTLAHYSTHETCKQFIPQLVNNSSYDDLRDGLKGQKIDQNDSERDFSENESKMVDDVRLDYIIKEVDRMEHLEKEFTGNIEDKKKIIMKLQSDFRAEAQAMQAVRKIPQQ